jgi:peptidoglycan/xylan/chitin deacetylase (PgdA/CDA1 family)
MITTLNRLSKVSIAIAFYLLWQTTRWILRIFKRKLASSLVILTYHSVTAEHRADFARQMDVLLGKGEPIRLDQPIPQFNNRSYFAVSFDDGYESVIQNALPVLQERNIPFTFFITTGAFGKKPPWIKDRNHPFAQETILKVEDLKALPDNIVTIGSHTVSHTKLININAETLRREVSESKKALQLLSGREVTLISVPYGQFDQKHTNVFLEEGYRRVFLNIPTYPITKTNQYLLGRVGVEPADWPIEYCLKLAGAYQWLPLAIRMKAVLFR